ncbi:MULTISPECIES: hypothetical protein [Rhodopseudomonas]|uniref:Outer membrane protein beta-barrel domain-containing protein n=1 Tax=Rhodopseudomonas palustris TaxID=1076 RepID=A0A0D7ES00_RHOPL|nr:MULTISPECIES: hypothetical protein [Rhodopseudomonas]KIZ43609.1 hypothetical protein OO17_11085 [Rhodopseudomonas palustris]MDF3808837.1 hypothetical protein [Rhodopseudomonas sp. BAL398]WOK18558.1 hypothetical protein RBJ75_03245 [Rhodopseudomonas sp. BAL398]
MIFATKTAVAIALMALAGPAGAMQLEPVRYWVPGGPFGFGGGATETVADSYSNVPGFEAGSAGDWRDNFRTGLFVRNRAGAIDLNGFGQTGAYGGFGSLSYQGGLVGYNYKGAGDLPMTFYTGFDKLTYDPGTIGALTPFSSDSGIPAGYNARAGVVIQPAPNVSLSFEAGITQYQSGRIDSDIHSPLLPGQSTLFLGR